MPFGNDRGHGNAGNKGSSDAGSGGPSSWAGGKARGMAAARFSKKSQAASSKDRAMNAVAGAMRENERKETLRNIVLSEESKEIIRLLEDTAENMFITGRAGTGKSTLLGYFREHTKKNVVVVAPTGVAALNVRGQTIHGFFKFKIGVTEHDIKKLNPDSLDGKMYAKVDTLVIDEISMVRADLFDCIDKFMRLNGKIPGMPFGGAQVVVIGDLFQLPPVVGYGEQHIFETKYESPYFFDSKGYKEGGFAIVELMHVYRQSDPLFIDILDKIRTGEAEMQHVKYINERCFEGDLPGASGATAGYGAKRKAGRTLSRSDGMLYVDDDGLPIEESGELDTIFTSIGDSAADAARDLLDRTRKNAARPAEESSQRAAPVSEKNALIDDLKKRFGLKTAGISQEAGGSASAVPDKGASSGSDAPALSVYLVTTNAMAEGINAKKLQEQTGDAKTYKGSLTGRFDQKNVPAPAELTLKIGSQVMTLKNDPGGRWVNGDIGIVEKLLDMAVRVRFEDGRVEDVIGDSWEMVKYDYDPIMDKVGSEVVGKYMQIPVKLAWAVTIHKSQGKTFDKAIIDFGAGAFAHGQAYVALSRVRSLEGITLKTPLTPRDVKIDERVREFLMGSR